MQKRRNFSLGLLLAAFCWVQSTNTVSAQQVSPGDEVLTHENFAQILKEEWMFLRDETDNFLKLTERRGEFETAQEFAVRLAREKSAYVNRVNGHIREKKFDRRVFSVLFKAAFVSYSVDSALYSITSRVSVEAPYDIPSVNLYVPSNPYIALGDTIRSGYRASTLYLKFKPSFKWKVSRDEAVKAKADEGSIHFKVRFVLDLNQAAITKQALLRIIPKDLELFNQTKQLVYWREELK